MFLMRLRVSENQFWKQQVRLCTSLWYEHADTYFYIDENPVRWYIINYNVNHAYKGNQELQGQFTTC